MNTKLKKYDKIIQKYIKEDVEETKYCSVPIVNTGMNSDIRKFLNKVMYGWYQKWCSHKKFMQWIF